MNIANALSGWGAGLGTRYGANAGAVAWGPATWRASAAIVLTFVVLAPFLNEYSFDERHSRWYLLPVVQATDPTLFAGDPVVNAVSRFRSVFYDLLAVLVGAFNVSARDLPHLLWPLFTLLQASIVLVVFGISRQLSRNLALFALLAAWCVQQRGGVIGGDLMFTPTLTHREVAECLGLVAIALVLGGRHLAAMLVLSATVFIHVLVAVHLFVAMIPVVVVSERRLTRPVGAGVLVFALSVVWYALLLAPPPMDTQASEIFLTEKAAIGHVSLSSQTPLQWLEMGALMALAFGVWARLGPTPHVRLLEGFCLSAAAFGLSVSGLFHFTSLVPLAQLQPLRSFTWVTFFTVVLLAYATSLLLAQRGPFAVVLLGVIAFEMLGGVMRFAFLALGLVYLVGASLTTGNVRAAHRVERFTVVATIALLGSAIVAWLSGDAVRFESLRSVVTPLVALALAPLVVIRPERAEWRFACVLAVIGISACGASVMTRQAAAKARPDSAWLTVMAWSRVNTEHVARFVTPPDLYNFRPYALRSSVNEVQPPLPWVDPALYAEQLGRETALQAVYRATPCDSGRLLALAKQWEANYVIARKACGALGQPEFETDQLGVYRVR